MSTPLFHREYYRWALQAPAAIRYQAAAVRVTHATPKPKGFHIGCEFVVHEVEE